MSIVGNVHAHHKGMRVVTTGRSTGRRLAADFPGWGHPQYRDYLLPIPAGVKGTITSVESHGNAPYTRYTVALDDGTRIIGADPERDVEFYPRNRDEHFAFRGAALTRCSREIRYHNDPTGRTWWLGTTQDDRYVTCADCQEIGAE